MFPNSIIPNSFDLVKASRKEIPNSSVYTKFTPIKDSVLLMKSSTMNSNVREYSVENYPYDFRMTKISSREYSQKNIATEKSDRSGNEGIALQTEHIDINFENKRQSPTSKLSKSIVDNFENLPKDQLLTSLECHNEFSFADPKNNDFHLKTMEVQMSYPSESRKYTMAANSSMTPVLTNSKRFNERLRSLNMSMDIENTAEVAKIQDLRTEKQKTVDKFKEKNQ